MQTLHPSRYTPFPGDALRPEGWLRRQLEIQAQGLCGNLDKVWPDIRDSRWIGGECEGWELVPYWLDGFIPLAWLLDDLDMQRRAGAYIDGILARQQPDGWICPCDDDERPQYDVWAMFLICKVLVQYHDFTGDDRIQSAIYRVLRRLYRHLNRHTLFDWSLSRWFECLIPLFWLYERRPEPWLLDLAYTLRFQGIDWRGFFERPPQVQQLWQGDRPAMPAWSYLTHSVNIAMALKAEALLARLDSDIDAANARARTALDRLMRGHGTAAGHFSGDECLAGNGPTAPMELCSVVEAMYAYEHLLAATADPYWGDRLEQLAFGALPAAFSPAMWARLHVCRPNQLCYDASIGLCASALPKDEDAADTGPAQQYSCCTANGGQGFPKFARSVMMRAPDGIAITAIAPATLTTQVDGVPIRCTVQTEYPFRDAYTVHIVTRRPVVFTLWLRIPGFVDGAAVDGVAVSPGKSHPIRRQFDRETSITVCLTMHPTLTGRPSGLYAATRGPLVFAYAPQACRTDGAPPDAVDPGGPEAGYALGTCGPWAFGFANDTLAVGHGPIGTHPFSPQSPAIWLEATLAPVAWTTDAGQCAAVPDGTAPTGAAHRTRLVPYGCASLSMTEMPMVGEGP